MFTWVNGRIGGARLFVGEVQLYAILVVTTFCLQTTEGSKYESLGPIIYYNYDQLARPWPEFHNVAVNVRAACANFLLIIA